MVIRLCNNIGVKRYVFWFLRNVEFDKLSVIVKYFFEKFRFFLSFFGGYLNVFVRLFFFLGFRFYSVVFFLFVFIFVFVFCSFRVVFFVFFVYFMVVVEFLSFDYFGFGGVVVEDRGVIMGFRGKLRRGGFVEEI